MAETPDTSAAFEAEAEQVDTAARRAELEAQLAQLDDRDTVLTGDVVTDEENTDDEAVVPDEIEIDGRIWHYFPPTEGQFTVFAMASSQARGLTGEKRLRRMYGFLENLFTEDDFEDALAMIEDRNHPFTFDDLMTVVTEIADKVANPAPANRAERRAVSRRK